MSQPKVHEFFSARKRLDAQPAKKRKVELTTDSFGRLGSLTTSNSNKDTNISEEDVHNKIDDLRQSPSLSINGEKRVTVSTTNPDLLKTGSSAQASSDIMKTRSVSMSTKLQPSSLSSRSRSSKQRQRTSVKSKSQEPKSQAKITELLQSADRLGSKSTGSVLGETQGDSNSMARLTGEKVPEMVANEVFIIKEVTSTKDDSEDLNQGSTMVTPRKRNIKIEAETEPPKTRKCIAPVRRLTSDHPPDLSKSAKKKLDLNTSESEKVSLNEPEVEAGSSQAKDPFDDSKRSEMDHQTQSGKTSLLRLISDMESPNKPVSPLALTPEHQSGSSTPDPQENPSIQPASPKLKNISQKLKSLSKMNGKALKNRLKQSGKLEDIKEKLGDLSKALDSKIEVQQKADSVVPEEPKIEAESLPAYQRFEYLAKAGKPTLTLPFHYKTLEGAFQAMDTVVSMLHNRSEVCTFSKLKAAVQNFTKKNFEKETIGQIKTVAPDAYILCQEKHVCRENNKKEYDLTVEADLSKEVDENLDQKISKTPEGKPTFTPAALIRRKQHFHSSLLGLVIKHHRKFLATLEPPMSIPDNKLMRWHPKFQLDQVPVVNPSPLPLPPEVKVYHSARDVLNAQRGKMNPRVEAALAKVAAENEKNDKIKAQAEKPVSKPAASTSNSPCSKGIPPALLAKIRAKEAMKVEAALTRNPAEDSKTKMMGHLPEMIRIVRSYFVTEKKPALPTDAVYKMLETSYRTGMSRNDVEQHVRLLTELAPELLSRVEIKRGSFLKLDRNVDVQAVSARIMKLVQTRK